MHLDRRHLTRVNGSIWLRDESSVSGGCLAVRPRNPSIWGVGVFPVVRLPLPPSLCSRCAKWALKRIQQYRRSRGDARVAEIRSPLDEKPNEDNDPVYGVLDERETQTTLGPAWNAISRRSAASARLEILIGE